MLFYSCKIPPFFSKNKAFTPYAFSNATGSLKAEKGREIFSILVSSGNRQADKGNGGDTYSDDPCGTRRNARIMPSMSAITRKAAKSRYYKSRYYKEVIISQASSLGQAESISSKKRLKGVNIP